MRVTLADASRRFLIAATLAGLSACRDVPTEPLAEMPASESLSAVPRSHQALARMVAHALRDPQVRAELHASLRSSPVFEDKVHLLGHLSRAESAPLLSRMAASPAAQARGIRSAEGVLALARSIESMEMYFPVGEHRAQWDGGENMIVAAAAGSDAAPFGVTLGGEPVMLSAGSPPAIPTLVITPAEAFGEMGQPITQSLKAEPYRQSRSQQAASGPAEVQASQATMGYKTQQRGRGVYEFYEYIRTWHAYESWWEGMPEFSIYLTGTSDSDKFAELHTRYDVPTSIWGMYYTYGDWIKMPDRVQMIYWLNFGTRIKSNCNERDGGGESNFSIGGSTILKGVDVNFGYTYTVRHDDDRCGYNYIVARKTDGTWTRIPTRSSQVLNEAGGNLQWAGYGWVP